MPILKLLLKQFICASVGEQKSVDNIKMHGMYVNIPTKYCLPVNKHKHGDCAQISFIKFYFQLFVMLSPPTQA